MLRFKQSEAIRSSATRRLVPAKKQKGSTLIEVLVSLLLLSFTLLGIAGLMGATTRFQLGVDTRSAISLLLNDLGNRVRSNPTESTAYVYDGANWAAQQTVITAPPVLCGATDAVACTTAERAAYDVWEMRTVVRRLLPQGSLLIAGDPANGMTMSFLWFDKDFLEDASTLRQSPTCTTSMNAVQLQSCCPTAASVGSTVGVRCLNYTFIR